MPYILLGEHIHAEKETSFGLGKHERNREHSRLGDGLAQTLISGVFQNSIMRPNASEKVMVCMDFEGKPVKHINASFPAVLMPPASF